MRGSPPNFYGILGSSRSRKRPCDCCGETVSGPNVYGSGRFCSDNCAKLRTPEAHWNWLTQNPDELKKWQERQEGKKTEKPSVVTDLPLAHRKYKLS